MSADTSTSENSPSWICQIWHPKNGTCPPFGHIGRSPSEIFARHTNSVRRTRLWGSQPVGVTLFLGESGYDGALFSKNIGLGLLGWRGGGWDLQKIQSVWGFRKDFPHLWTLLVQIREGWGPLMWPKWGYRENPWGFYRIVFSLYTQGDPWALCGAWPQAYCISPHTLAICWQLLSLAK